MLTAYHSGALLSRANPYSHLVDGGLPLKFPRVLTLSPMIPMLYALGALRAFAVTPTQLTPGKMPEDSSHQVG